MNILLVTTHLNVGGITSYLFTLTRQFLLRGHRVYMISSGGTREDDFARLGATLIRANVRTKSEVNPALYFQIPRFLRIIKENRIDIIHSHTRVTQVLGQVLGYLSKVPYVATCHGFYKTRWFRKACPSWGKAVAAISQPVKTHLVSDFKVPEDKVYLIPNGVDVDMINPFDEETKKRNREKFQISQSPVIGMVSRLEHIKGHGVMINAMPEILKVFPSALLFIAGEGKAGKDFEAQTHRLGLEKHVRFASIFNPFREIHSLLDVFAMPSLDEGFGLSGMEAQAAGVPVVASNVGGIPTYVVHEKTGLLVPPNDSAALAAALIRVLKNPDYAKELSGQAREFVKNNFSAENTANLTLSMYDDVGRRL